MVIKTKFVSSHTADSKLVKQEVNLTVILPPLVFPDSSIFCSVYLCMAVRLRVQGLQSSVIKEIYMEKLVNSKDKKDRVPLKCTVQQELLSSLCLSMLTQLVLNLASISLLTPCCALRMKQMHYSLRNCISCCLSL